MVNPHVTILLAVYNGQPHLAAQLDSFAAQDHGNWQVLASDDGSGDDSLAVLQSFAKDHPLVCLEGPRQGGSENFMSLVRRAADHAPADHWLAFSDQDDVWLPHKLSRAIDRLSAVERPGQPALYCSRTWITDEGLQNRRLSPPRPKPLAFRNALVQNVVAGNTILLNAAAARLVEAAAQKTGTVIVHDWWVYQIISGHGGVILHDDEPGLLYRQHAINQIGANDTWQARIKRLYQLMRGDLRDWNTVNIAAMQAALPHLSAENQAVLARFASLRQRPLPQRLYQLWQLRTYRQSLAGTLALWAAAILKKL